MTDASEEEDEESGRPFPVKGPATGQQAVLAISLVFFLGVVLGFLLCSLF